MLVNKVITPKKDCRDRHRRRGSLRAFLFDICLFVKKEGDERLVVICFVWVGQKLHHLPFGRIP